MEKNKTMELYFKRYEKRKGKLNNNINVVKLVNTTITNIKKITIDLENQMITYIKKNNTKISKDISEILIKELRIILERN